MLESFCDSDKIIIQESSVCSITPFSFTNITDLTLLDIFSRNGSQLQRR